MAKILMSFLIITFIVACKTDGSKSKQTIDTTVSMTSLLNEMLDRDIVASFPQHDFRLRQSSTYNRASKTPSDTTGWFTNYDFNRPPKEGEDHDPQVGNFIRLEENNGEKEWVIMDDEGPGTLVRTWMPFNNPKDQSTTSIIKIYLDGASEPVMQGNTLGLLNGTGLIPFPLAHKSLRSSVSFFPIPYAKSCKITVSELPFFYQMTYREYDEGTPIKTFTIEDFNRAQTLVKDVCESLLSIKNTEDGKTVVLNESLSKGQEKSVALPQGTSAIRGLTLKLGDYSDDKITRSVVLKMEFDGQEIVWCPIGDFFGSGIGINPYQGWYRTVEDDGTMSSRWVMPYQNTAKVSIVNFGEASVDVQLKAVVGEYDWTENSMYFNAAWRGEYPVRTRPFSDWNYITLQGRGVYVGDALTVWNPVKRWWGEGDEKIWVDGEDFPSIFGTGTEDYYGYSWGGLSNDFYEHPFHAQPVAAIYNKHNRKTEAEFGERNTQGYSTETRSRALDVMPFGSSLQLDMEVWSWTVCSMEYGVGMYWYGDAATTSNRKPDPLGLASLNTNTKETID